jgi:hypothetical protein
MKAKHGPLVREAAVAVEAKNTAYTGAIAHIGTVVEQLDQHKHDSIVATNGKFAALEKALVERRAAVLAEIEAEAGAFTAPFSYRCRVCPSGFCTRFGQLHSAVLFACCV